MDERDGPWASPVVPGPVTAGPLDRNTASRRTRVRFDWGPTGAAAIAAGADVAVVVDVLSFTTTLSSPSSAA